MAQMKNHRHLPAFILLDLVQHENHGSAICHNLVRDLPDFQCDTAAVYRALSRLEREGLWCIIGIQPNRDRLARYTLLQIKDMNNWWNGKKMWNLALKS